MNALKMLSSSFFFFFSFGRGSKPHTIESGVLKGSSDGTGRIGEKYKKLHLNVCCVGLSQN